MWFKVYFPTAVYMFDSPESYGISNQGFLPPKESFPCLKLPNEYMAWEELVENLSQSVLNVENFRSKLRNLDVIHISCSFDDLQLQRAYLVLSCLAHAYVWCGGEDQTNNVLPRGISIPWFDVCTRINIVPALAHAGIDTWNYRYEHEEKYDSSASSSVRMAPERLRSLITFTGHKSEEWFYLIPVAMEAVGSDIVCKSFDLPSMIDRFVEFLESGSDDFLARIACVSPLLSFLTELASNIDTNTTVLRRMYEYCEPMEFYTRQRPFLAGFGHSASVSDGLILEGIPFHQPYSIYPYYSSADCCHHFPPSWLEYAACPPLETPEIDQKNCIERKDESWMRIKVKGGSAGQSALIHLYDCLLGVIHQHSGGDEDKKHESDETEDRHKDKRVEIQEAMSVQAPFFAEMRRYMPGGHRRFLSAAETVGARLRLISCNDIELVEAFNKCVDALTRFRASHIGIVHTYIISMKRKLMLEEQIKKKMSISSNRHSSGNNTDMFMGSDCPGGKNKKAMFPALERLVLMRQLPHTRRSSSVSHIVKMANMSVETERKSLILSGEVNSVLSFNNEDEHDNEFSDLNESIYSNDNDNLIQDEGIKEGAAEEEEDEEEYDDEEEENGENEQQNSGEEDDSIDKKMLQNSKYFQTINTQRNLFSDVAELQHGGGAVTVDESFLPLSPVATPMPLSSGLCQPCIIQPPSSHQSPLRSQLKNMFRGHADSSHEQQQPTHKSLSEQGTGGTNLMPFLLATREVTQQARLISNILVSKTASNTNLQPAVRSAVNWTSSFERVLGISPSQSFVAPTIALSQMACMISLSPATYQRILTILTPPSLTLITSPVSSATNTSHANIVVRKGAVLPSNLSLHPLSASESGGVGVLKRAMSRLISISSSTAAASPDRFASGTIQGTDTEF